jgi:hypothetical protein
VGSCGGRLGERLREAGVLRDGWDIIGKAAEPLDGRGRDGRLGARVDEQRERSGRILGAVDRRRRRAESSPATPIAVSFRQGCVSPSYSRPDLSAGVGTLDRSPGHPFIRSLHDATLEGINDPMVREKQIQTSGAAP